jgi:hypothetical protein
MAGRKGRTSAFDLVVYNRLRMVKMAFVLLRRGVDWVRTRTRVLLGMMQPITHTETRRRDRFPTEIPRSLATYLNESNDTLAHSNGHKQHTVP